MSRLMLLTIASLLLAKGVAFPGQDAAEIAILWAWGGIVVALLLTNFLSAPVEQSSAVSSITFLGSLAILFALTCTTGRWLGGKEKVAHLRPGGAFTANEPRQN